MEHNAYKSANQVFLKREERRCQEGRVVQNSLVSSYWQQSFQKHTVTCKLSPHGSPENIFILRPLQSRVARCKTHPSHTLKCFLTVPVHSCQSVPRFITVSVFNSPSQIQPQFDHLDFTSSCAQGEGTTFQHQCLWFKLFLQGKKASHDKESLTLILNFSSWSGWWLNTLTHCHIISWSDICIVDSKS